MVGFNDTEEVGVVDGNFVFSNFGLRVEFGEGYAEGFVDGIFDFLE